MRKFVLFGNHRYQPKHLKRSRRSSMRSNRIRLSIFDRILISSIAILSLINICGSVIVNHAERNIAFHSINDFQVPSNFKPVNLSSMNIDPTIIEDNFVGIDIYHPNVEDGIEEVENKPTNDIIPIHEVEIEVIEEVEPITLEDQLGNDTIIIDNAMMTRYDLPNVYYEGIDFSSFQPYMYYTAITNTSAPAYHIVHSQNCYTDEFGLRRYKVTEDQFSIDGQDDYVIALGTYYKPKGVVGNRYLIVTTNGMYTAITGDEKADYHTDSMHMFTSHGNNKAGIIEWIVDYGNLAYGMRQSGTVTIGGPEVVAGEILYIYGIE